MDQFWLLFVLAWPVVSYFLYWPLFNGFLARNQVRSVLLGRIYGGLLFGGVPLVLTIFLGISFQDIGLQLPAGKAIYHIAPIVVSFLIVVVSWMQSGHPANLRDFPQIREKEWSICLVVQNILTWMLYLIGYEILFRGVFLFPLVEAFGLWPGVFVNVGIYSLVHTIKNYREGLATIPLGVLFALIALKTGSIYYVVVIHWVMSISTFLFSLNKQPGMNFSLNYENFCHRSNRIYWKPSRKSASGKRA